MPESPKWLAKKKRYSHSYNVLKRVYRGGQTEKEFKLLVDEVEKMSEDISQSECQQFS